MARKTIDIGAVGNDGTGDSIRDSFRKVNDNFRELYSSLGLGERLTFLGLSDTPDLANYDGLTNITTGATPVVTVNNLGDGVTFKQLVAGSGVSLDFTTNTSEIRINSDFSEISADPSPQLGGNLSLRSGNVQHRIFDAGTTADPLSPIFKHELVNKFYADSKISRAGANSVDPETGNINSALGRMSGPLILSRDPEPDDDNVFGGLIAATKRYVDNSAFGSSVNLYVALSGSDYQPGVSKNIQGRALAYAYRTLEAALSRAEELVNEARAEIGPYKKVLTYNNGEDICTLNAIVPAPDSGVGFVGQLRMSIDKITLASVGTNYYPGDIISLVGGGTAGGGTCTIEILSTLSTPGSILSFRIISAGSYSNTLPGSTNVTTTIINSAAPLGVGAIGVNATFNVTYKVNSVSIDNGGTGYGLVSVRVTGGGGTGAFGNAVVDNGIIDSITITDRGSNFTSIPTLSVDLPRFLIETENSRTDFTGNVTDDTAGAKRSRDIREGLYLRGETSGALAQILSHQGELDSAGREIFDVDVKFGNFVVGESISYGDVSKNIQISVLVESGEYYENYPLKVPANVSIVGDEFRRVIIRPKPGISSSPWALQKFRRDLEIDKMTISSQLYGYHYLQDAATPVIEKVNNKGAYDAVAALLLLNREFLIEETIAWINNLIQANTAPFILFSYNSSSYKNNIATLIDSIVFDIKYGNYNRTVSTGLKYYEDAVGKIIINSQLTQYLLIVDHLTTLIQDAISNTEIQNTDQDLFLQIIDLAYSAETGSVDVITELTSTFKTVINPASAINFPKENQEMDVFLANDSVRWQAISAIGHGGFMGVLDPEGQILSRSPYFQECASFSRSKGRQVFAGGMFVDGFSGNLEFNIDTVITPTRLEVSALERFPQLPASFIVADTVYRVNYVRDFAYNKNGSSATLILDETTPWPFAKFQYNSTACSRDVGLILDGLGYDIVFQTNYWTRLSGLTYRLAQSAVVIDEQRTITLEAIKLAHAKASENVSAFPVIQQTVDQSNIIISDIVSRGVSAAPDLFFTVPTGIPTNVVNAYNLLLVNQDYISAEISGWANAQIIGNISPWTSSDTYSSSRLQRDIRTAVESVIYDLLYGGNLASRTTALKYYNNLTGDPVLTVNDSSRWSSAVAYANYLAKQIVQNLSPVTSYSLLPRISGTAATIAEANIINSRMLAISSAIAVNNFSTASSAITVSPPSVILYPYGADRLSARDLIDIAKPSIQQEVVDYVDFNGNRYELLMPGNRSMLGNDYTQINDMGYGAIAHNGGLMELVSVFTYYCYTSYYSLNGGQIRSIGGSSAHGVYGLVAEGSDPLEVPTPNTIYENFSQRVVCYAPIATYENKAGGLIIFVNRYDYTPLNNSELEINHDGEIFRYTVTSVTTSDLPAGVARLNLSAGSGGSTQGLLQVVNDGEKMTLRANGQILLTGDLEDVAVRPSTGLQLKETDDSVYRVLQFDSVQDSNGPYEISISNSNPAVVKVLTTIVNISGNTCTTNANHKLSRGDKFIPLVTANGFINGTVYYVISVPEYNQFTVSTTPSGSILTLSSGSALLIKGIKTHKLLENYSIELSSSGTLPTGLVSGQTYFVLPTDLSDTEFLLSGAINGNPIATSDSGSGIHSYAIQGLTSTILRENYNYVDITLYQPGEFATFGKTCTISIAPAAVITLTGHGFIAGDVIKFETAGSLPLGISAKSKYFVLSNGLTLNQFQVSTAPGGVPANTNGTQTGAHTVGLIKGRAGDQTLAVVAVGQESNSRVTGSKFVFLGEEYIISNYAPENVTNLPYARITLDRPLVDSIIQFSSSYTIKSAVPIRSSGSLGTLTIRISLTRVTSHDLLEIGTGSYADTNYPKEIYGGSVNPVNPSNETQERTVGRCFYVTTDQFGNFNVGPYFKVDQGTGQVTFSSSIALSNLDGIGFKRGVPISEFSTDSAFTDNASDTVPTENATRIYIDRRLGVSHDGAVLDPTQVIPLTSGGFMSLSGQTAMTGDMNVANFRIRNVANPSFPQDAVNLRSITLANLQDFQGTSIASGDFMVFKGVNNSVVNASILSTSDIDVGFNPTTNKISLQIKDGAIVNSDIASNAAIPQSKLSMTAAGTRADAIGITQIDLGLASFNSSDFVVTNGWVSIKENSIALSDIVAIPAKVVLGNSTAIPGNTTSIPFATVVNEGLGIKKSQYSGIGFLKRISNISGLSDPDYTIVNSSTGSSVSVGANDLVVRDLNGDFGGRIVDVSQLKIDTSIALDSSTTATGGVIRLYGFNTQGGILISDGTVGTDKRSQYWNDRHEFKTQNGVNNAPVIASSIQVNEITAGGNTNTGTITGRWTLTGSTPNESRLQATYSADLAENYEGDRMYDVGTVLVFGGDKEVTSTDIKGDTRVAGVVSNTAAYTMYEACPGFKNLVALQGRVPCRVVGKINKGDILITSGIPGVAVAASGDVKVGTVVGKALTTYDSDHIGSIEIAVGRT
jgi:hypothetical protein